MPGVLNVTVAATLALVQICTFLCNGCITTGLIWSKQYRTGSNILILHLAVVDVCLSVSTLLATVPSYVKEDWISGDVECALYGGITLLLHAVILWTICGLNYDKFSAICVPLSYNDAVTKWKTTAALVVCWVFSAGCAFLPLSAGLSYQLRAGLCLPQFRRLRDGVFGILYICGMLLLPAALIVFFNVRILIVARTQRSRIVSAIVSAVTMNAQLAVPQQRLECSQRSRSPLGTTVNVLLPLLVMYLPFASLVTWESVAGVRVDERVTLGTHVLLCLSPIHGLIYGCRSKNLRRVFKNFVRKQLYKSEMQLEIQARAPRTCLQRPSIATQLTMQLPKQLQRRLSDAFIKTPNQRRRRRRRRHARLRRQASELTWAQVSQQLEGPREPFRARSTDAIAADSDSSSGSPMAQRSPASLAIGAAALAARAFRFPAVGRGASTRSPLPIPHNPAAAAAARGQLNARHSHRVSRSLSDRLNTTSSPSPSPTPSPSQSQPNSPLPVPSRSPSLSPPLSPLASVPSAGLLPATLSDSCDSEKSGLWLRRLEDRCQVEPSSSDDKDAQLEHPRPGRSGRLCSDPSAVSLSGGEAWRGAGERRRPAVPRACSVEPQMV